MKAAAVFERLAAAGISVAIEGENSLVVEPASSLTDELRSMIREHKSLLLDYLSKREAHEERAAIMEFDAHLDRPAAERAAHRLIFCRDCIHHLPSEDSVSRSGFRHAEPSGCRLSLITPNSWPPIYAFTGWCCPCHESEESLALSGGRP